MEELKIKLTYDPEHFEEIYYQNGQGSILTYKPTRKALAYLCLVSLLTVLICLASYQWPGISWLIVLAAIVLLLTAMYAFNAVKEYQSWRRTIKTYLKELAQYRSYSLQLTPAAIEVTTDSTISLEKWDNIKSVQLFNTHIILHKPAEVFLFLPAKSMKREEFHRLKDFIQNKMMTEEKPPSAQMSNQA